MSIATAATTLSPEQARTLFDHLLPAIVNSRALTRELIRNVADSKLDFVPIAGGETLSDLMWYLASAYDVFLNALCDAKFPDLPSKPQPGTVQSFLDWDDTRFEQTVQRSQGLSDADLLRPLSFGSFTQPSVEFMTMFIGNVAQHTGQLMIGLALVAQAQGEVIAVKAPSADGELSDAELAGVAGGAGAAVANQGVGTDGFAVPNVTVNYNGPALTMDGINHPTQANLGSLLGDGGGGYGAVGMVGAQAILMGWVFGTYIGTAAGIAAKAAAMAGLMMVLRI